jgi:hypothetical protein
MLGVDTGRRSFGLLLRKHWCTYIFREFLLWVTCVICALRISENFCWARWLYGLHHFLWAESFFLVELSYGSQVFHGLHVLFKSNLWDLSNIHMYIVLISWGLFIVSNCTVMCLIIKKGISFSAVWCLFSKLNWTNEIFILENLYLSLYYATMFSRKCDVMLSNNVIFTSTQRRCEKYF